MLLRDNRYFDSGDVDNISLVRDEAAVAQFVLWVITEAGIQTGYLYCDYKYHAVKGTKLVWRVGNPQWTWASGTVA